jgi:hypothetical protein
MEGTRSKQETGSSPFDYWQRDKVQAKVFRTEGDLWATDGNQLQRYATESHDSCTTRRSLPTAGTGG